MEIKKIKTNIDKLEKAKEVAILKRNELDNQIKDYQSQISSLSKIVSNYETLLKQIESQLASADKVLSTQAEKKEEEQASE